MPNGFQQGGGFSWTNGWESYDHLSDDVVCGVSWLSLSNITNGSISASNSPLNIRWGIHYATIRKTNIFLQNVDNIPTDVTVKNQLKGEAQFIRALTYFSLVQLFGGVPLITVPQSISDDLTVKRNTRDECINFILKELDEAYNNIHAVAYQDGANYGKISKSAVLALKARILLHTGKWNEAAAAAKAVIDLGIFSLSTKGYQNLFLKSGDPVEIILPKLLSRTNQTDVNYFQEAQQPLYLAASLGVTCPTKNLMDDYEMTDGNLPAVSPLFNAADPFKNRDSRFYASIMYQGSPWTSNPSIDFSKNTTPTGANMKKFCDQTVPLDYFGHDMCFPVLRYAEVLINYAEAQNENVGPDASVYRAINSIRARATQPPLPSGLSQAQMRDAIRHEKHIEMAFESQRYFDLIRWGLAPTVLNAPLMGYNWTSATNYMIVIAWNRVFNPTRDIYFPIPQPEIDKNKNLVQNPGW